MKKDARIYRRVWIAANGPIPKDSKGRSYEIHHINGDHSDNRLENLKLVSIQEHYRIHYEQGDYMACQLMLKRMKMSPEENSRISSELHKKLAAEGRHAWQKKTEDGISLQRDRYLRGVSHLNGENHPARVASREGTHQFQKRNPGKDKFECLIDGRVVARNNMSRYFKKRYPDLNWKEHTRLLP